MTQVPRQLIGDEGLLNRCGASARPAAAAAPVQTIWTAPRLLAALALAALAVYIARQPWSAMIETGMNDEESSHIFLTAIAVAWIVMARWDMLRRCQVTHQWVGPLLVGLGWASLVYGYDIHDNEFWFFGAILSLIGAVFSVLGGSVLWKAWPAVLAMGFLIPVPGVIRYHVGIPLQTAMATCTQIVALPMGFDIARAGNVLLVGEHQVEVAEACNGMRMVFGLFMVAYTFAFVMPFRWPVRLCIFAAAPLVALACNVIRMVPTVWLYGHASKQTADQFHDILGWVMIPLAFIVLAATIRVVEWVGFRTVIEAPRRKGGRRVATT